MRIVYPPSCNLNALFTETSLSPDRETTYLSLTVLDISFTGKEHPKIPRARACPLKRCPCQQGSNQRAHLFVRLTAKADTLALSRFLRHFYLRSHAQIFREQSKKKKTKTRARARERERKHTFDPLARRWPWPVSVRNEKERRGAIGVGNTDCTHTFS